jgi:magnesium transporter
VRGVQVLTGMDRDRVREQRDRGEFFWLDLQDPAPDEVTLLGDVLGLHPIAMEDTHEFGQRPKLDVYEDHLLVVFYTARVTTGEDGRASQAIEVHVYVSGSYVVTVRRDRCTVLDDLHQALAPLGTADEEALVYRIFDTLTDAYYPVIEALESRIDALESEVLERARPEQRESIYRLRQEVRELHRLVATQRDQFGATSDAIRRLAGLARGSHEYLRDVADHLAQIAGEFGRQTDDLVALTGTYFNANADRLNSVLTRLTIFGTLFLAWTLVTGFFGQNFRWLVDNVESKHDFLVFGLGGLVVPTVIALGLLWLKRDDWF